MKFELHTRVSTTEVKAVSVILSDDVSQPHGIKMMHCMRCGEKLVQYQGRIMAVYPGNSPAMKLPLFVRCRQCQETYAIGSVSHTE